jgi:hypothetical protein|tara:strand:+ start:62 stop:580 length:519 start_codon:yes stop_codon:yes gene_type:complete
MGRAQNKLWTLIKTEYYKKEIIMIKICKYCAEEIKEAALVCKHCGKDQHIANDMQKHVTILSVIHFGIGAISLFAALIVFFLFPTIGNFVPKGTFPFDLFSVLAGGIGGFLVLFGAIKLLCGYGFYKRKSWARIYGLVLCGFGLINIPFGTLIAIYGIWVLIKSETAQLFIN